MRMQFLTYIREAGSNCYQLSAINWKIKLSGWNEVLQNKPQNGVNSFYIINNESESSESLLIQYFPDVPITKDLSKTKLNDNYKSSDPAENNNYNCDNQVYDLTTTIQAIKMFIK